MAERDVRERDILVAPNEYAYVQDLTKGHIILYVGPTKISLSNTERMILFCEGRFVPVKGEEAGLGVLSFVEATSAQYILLEGPTEEANVRPLAGANTAVAVRHGRKVVVPGPARFPLWPGQTAEVVDGHRLSQDEYLVVRVYDDTFSEALPPIGTEQVVRGTEHSFYVPPSGLMVVPSEGAYVRKAFRLDRKSGLHLRVVASLDAGDGEALPAGHYEAGRDLFLRDREGLFFPTEAVEVMGRVEAIPLAEDQGLYVRELDEGTVRIVEGPVSFLIDPTREEIAERLIDETTARLYGVAGGSSGYARALEIPPSTAVMITSKNRREVVIGPCTRTLGYEEDVETLQLSTGRPKSADTLLSTCFLRVEGNKVSDVVVVETSDHVALEILLSYRVSFTGEAQRWFNVDDYVGLLCDHASSLIRAAARTTPVESFHADGTPTIRDAVLGAHDEEGRRVGRRFEENGMWVYDVEVLAVGILDPQVAGLLGEAQRMAIASAIDRKKEELRLGDERLREAVTRAILEQKAATLTTRVGLETERREVELAKARTQLALDRLDNTERARHEAEAVTIRAQAHLAAREGEVELDRRALDAKASAFAREMEAIAPELIATLRALGNERLAAELSRNLSPLAILGGESVADVAERLLDRLPLALGENKRGLASLLTAVPDSGAEE